jgi:tetratricopeptide (TPR) repeat protein
MGDLPSTRPVPTATGTLARTPLVHLLLYALEKKLAGTIEFAAPPGRKAAILFVAGRPAKARTTDAVAYLGRTLVELGLLDEAAHSRSLAELAEAKSQGPALHGQLLLEAGLIEPSRLDAGLREQLVRKLRSIAGMPAEATYEYLAGFDGLRDFGPDLTHGLDVVPMVWRLLNESPPGAHVDAALDRIAASPLRLAKTAQVARLSLGKEELAAAELLRVRPMRVDEFAMASGLGPDARLLMYLLLVTKQVDVLRPASPSPASIPPSTQRSGAAADVASPAPPQSSHAPSPSSHAPSPSSQLPPRASPPPPRGSPPPPRASQLPPLSSQLPPPRDVLRSTPGDSLRPVFRDSRLPTPGESMRPAARVSVPPGQRSTFPRPPTAPPTRPVPSVPPGLSPELRERWEAIADRARWIDRTDYFSMLDLARDATQEEVETAFFAEAKKWHPDRLPPELAALRDACSRVFARISEAHATLSNPEERAHYMHLVAEGSGSPAMRETVAKVLEAATHFQKAEVCFRRNDLAQAEEFCRKAIENDATQSDYLAMLAWLLALKPENQSPEKTRTSIHMLDRAIEMNEKCERAYFWRGMLFRRLGRADTAVRDFKRAVNLNPHNIDAAREIRLYRMRGGRHTSRPPSTPSSPGMPAQRSNSGSDPPRASEETKPGIFGRFFKK